MFTVAFRLEACCLAQCQFSFLSSLFPLISLSSYPILPFCFIPLFPLLRAVCVCAALPTPFGLIIDFLERKAAHARAVGCSRLATARTAHIQITLDLSPEATV